MAVTKDYINGSLDTLYNWLTANATDYFDNIVKGDSDITCYVDEVDFFKISPSSNGIWVKTKYGATYHPYSSSYNDVAYAIKTPNAIAFNIHTNSFGIIITKDNNDKTAVVWLGSSGGNVFKPVTNSSNTIYAVSVESESINSVNVFLNIGTAVTSLCPMIVSGTIPRYLPNVFVSTFAQYSEESRYQITNSTYYSNGLLAIKDE